MTIWKEKELKLKDLKKVKSLKFCKTDASWINCYHKGIPAFRTEKAYIIGRWDLPAVSLLKFNIFCFSQSILNEITPDGFRIPDENDWNKIKLSEMHIDTVFPEKYNGEHHSFLFFSKNNFPLGERDFFSVKPDKSLFIRDLERTACFKFDTVTLNQSNQLESSWIIDFAGYPRFMIKFIEYMGTSSV